MLRDAFSSVLSARIRALGLSQSQLGALLGGAPSPADWPAAKIRVLIAGTIRAGEVSLPEAVSLADALGMSLDDLAEAAGGTAPQGAGQ